MGFFDNMGDRPIREPEWRPYAVEGTVADDAENVVGNAGEPHLSRTGDEGGAEGLERHALGRVDHQRPLGRDGRRAVAAEVERERRDPERKQIGHQGRPAVPGGRILVSQDGERKPLPRRPRRSHDRHGDEDGHPLHLVRDRTSRVGPRHPPTGMH